MKKRVFYIPLFILLVIFVLAGCSGEPDKGAPATNDGDGTVSPGPDITLPPAVFSFKMGDIFIEMDEDISKIITGLGEPLGILEAPSCAFDGTDRIFSYPGIQIYTYPKNGADHIHTIGFFDDSVVTAEGKIRLGSNIQSVFDAYGNDYRYETGMYTFTRGKTVLEFLVSDDIIIGITYRYLLDL